MMAHTLIRTVPIDEMRYKTAGDWLSDDPLLQTIVVVAMPDWRHSFLVALHELVEAALCNHRGIKEADVTAFDKCFAATISEDAEPGDDPNAPYYAEHQFASHIETEMADMLGVKWDEYEAAIRAAMNPTGG